jgi:hypothetical protein
MGSATQRTLSLLKKNGWRYEIVEKWNSFTKQRKDLFGFIDILCITDIRTIGVQSCGTAFADHHKKIMSSPDLQLWLQNRDLYLIGWRKLKKVGNRTYFPRIRQYFPDLTYKDLTEDQFLDDHP